MPARQRVAVIGSAIHAPRDARQRSLEEAMYAVGQSALADAGLAIDDIDGIVVGANDQLAKAVNPHGQMITCNTCHRGVSRPMATS